MKNTKPIATVIATPNEDGTLSALGSTWVRQEPKTGIEIGTKYGCWMGMWLKPTWDDDRIDHFRKANDLIAWTEADKPRIENRQKALLAAEEWFDANGRFVPKEGDKKWVVNKDGDVFGGIVSAPIGTRYVFETKADAEKFAADLKEHLKWL